LHLANEAALAGEPEVTVAVERRGVEVRVRRPLRKRKRADLPIGPADANDCVLTAVGEPGSMVGTWDDAVRRRVAAERDELRVTGLRIEPAEMAAALRAEPDAAVGRRRDVVDAGALARRERPAAHRRSVGTRGERPHGQESGAGEGSDCVASRADRHGGLLRE